MRSIQSDPVTFYIVTPSYNQAQFITQTIDSILSQSVQVKYLVMDGRSTDDTVKVLKRYGRKLKWISEKDRGQTDAINKGLIYFKKLKPKPQDIFAYLNSDDYYLPEALETVAATFANQPSADWLVGDCQIVDSQSQEIQPLVRTYKRVLRKVLSQSLLSVLNPIPQPAVFIKWRAIAKVGLFNSQLRYVMDYEYWLRLFNAVGAPLVIDTPLAAFRIHGSSKGGSQFDRQFNEELLIAKRCTQNPAWHLLHTVHNEMIKFVYRLIK